MRASTTRRQVKRPVNAEPFCAALRICSAKAQSKQEGKDGEELAEGEQGAEIQDDAVEGREIHEAGFRRAAGEKPLRAVRDDDAEQRHGAQYVDHGDAFAGRYGSGWMLHGGGLEDIGAQYRRDLLTLNLRMRELSGK